ncbi:LysR substrate-binding domain-containing protein [Chimaeribacter arupi]|uniref:LysR substrate-binding domain-containing protein n=1 Tax=Chimaeribacter arupi TaxID=2060066 RepID=UPI002946D666|nr:LysR substrate-binding domain-containing protein [Chimaeribacter arupi]MDV5139870.1 LysR substrate-binding domain-containing protein [Chimaeribacter arupi]
MSKRPWCFDLDALQSFVTGIELGSFAQAADRLGRSTSAVSAQLKKLEQQCGVALVEKSGRHLVPSRQGEVLLGYARRLLALNSEAALAVCGETLSGPLRVGMQEDFGERLLPAVLGAFSRAHPEVQLTARIGRNAELLRGITAGELDLALCWQWQQSTPWMASLGSVPLCWIGAQPGDVMRFHETHTPLPLVMFEAPCLMRQRATEALDRAGIPWRIALESRSLQGIWAAVSAGLGVTVRADAGLPENLHRLDAATLPALGDAGITLHQGSAGLTDAALSLKKQICHELALKINPAT